MRAVGVDAEGCYFLGLLSTMTGVNVLDVQFAFVRPILEFAVGVKATPKVMREQVSYCHATVPERCVRVTREAIETAFLRTRRRHRIALGHRYKVKTDRVR